MSSAASPPVTVSSSSSAETKSSSNNNNKSSNNNNSNSDLPPPPNRVPAAVVTEPCLWEIDNPSQLQTWIEKQTPLHDSQDASVSQQLWQNMAHALESVQETIRVEEPPSAFEDDMDEDESPNNVLSEPPKKRRKRTIRIRTLHDPFHIWLQAWKTNHQKDDTTIDGNKKTDTSTPSSSTSMMTLTDEHDDVPTTCGGKLSQLTVGGLMNALAAVPGGVVQKPTPLSNLTSNTTTLLATAANQSLHSLHETAVQLHRTIQARVRVDILRTTPLRIQQMLAPELTLVDFQGVRRRVYETVMLGKGMRSNEEEEASDLATAPPGSNSTVGIVESFKKCYNCGNNEQTAFVLDAKNGDVICESCGTVVSESIMHEGSQFRKFEGEEDRNHHGDTWNPLYSNSHNLSTTLGGIQVSGGINGWGSGGKRNLETILRNAHAYTELNVSQFGKTDRRTRIGYKDKQKKEAFVQMQHVGDALNLHEAVVQRAKEIFAGFRDDRELVQQFKPVIAACLCEAFEYLSQKGNAILKQDEVKQVESVAVGPISARGARRNELHSATLAGKGGLLIDFSSIEKEKLETAPSVASTANSPKTSEKSAAAWDLLDCRSWLLDASRRIAQHWIDERSKLESPIAKKIPSGTVDELEGMLVEHSILLCEYLESEIQSRNKNNVVAASKKTVTPRVTDMSKLSIKWQHHHERGSGGAGGLGASGPKAANSVGSDRTAGQVLMLLTSKKLWTILKDELAGEAFHKELRGLVAQQAELKRQKKLEEASRQRLHQMKRKPYLHARVLSS